MLIGMVIDDMGLVPDADSSVFAQFGDLVRGAFSAPIAELSREDLKNAPDKYRYELNIPGGNTPKYLVLAEDIAYGERVLGYMVNGSISGKCISHKRIIELPPGTAEIVLKITDAKAEPMMKTIAVY